MDEPTSGEVTLVGTTLDGLTETELTLLRRDHVGFVFQAFNLMPALSVRQNVALPATLAGRSPNHAWIDDVIDRVGLSARGDHRPAELSGGQQQRVAIARALAGRVDVIFADEPTGALDTQSAASVLRLLRTQVRAAGQMIVMVTHDPGPRPTPTASSTWSTDGRIVSHDTAQTAADVAQRIAALSTFANTGGRSCGAGVPA